MKIRFPFVLRKTHEATKAKLDNYATAAHHYRDRAEDAEMEKEALQDQVTQLQATLDEIDAVHS